MWKLDLVVNVDLVSLTYAEARGSPFTYAVHCEESCSLIRGWKESTCSMRLVVLGKDDLAFVSEAFADEFGNVQLLFEPKRHGHQE